MASSVDSTALKLSQLGINGDLASSVPNLKNNLHLLSSEQVYATMFCALMWILYFVVTVWCNLAMW